MNFTNALLMCLLAAQLPPGTTKTGVGLVAVSMLAIVAVRAAWATLMEVSDTYRHRL